MKQIQSSFIEKKCLEVSFFPQTKILSAKPLNGILLHSHYYSAQSLS